MRFARDVLPLLVAGGGMAAAYNSGLFDPNKGNNSVWNNLGKGLNADGTPNTNTGFPGAPGAPMQLPGSKFGGNPLAGSAPIPRAQPAFVNPSQAFQMPRQMQGGQQPPLLAAGAGPQPMMAQEWAYPNSMNALMRGQQPPSMAFSTDQQQPLKWANPATINYGLLGNSRGVA
jgi:hypothetical protein